MSITRITVILTLLICVFPQISIANPPYLIEFGWDMPDVPWLTNNIEKAEKTPFDGVVVDLGKRKANGNVSLGWCGWQKDQLDDATRKRVEEDIDLLRSAKFTKLSQIFIAFRSHPNAGFDWFDDKAFENVLNNWRLAAKAVREARLAGIFFDVEWYAKRQGPSWQPCAWNYTNQPDRNKYTFAQYQETVYQRGREIMKAIQKECPQMTILMPFTNSMPGLADNPQNLKTFRYGLLPSFIDGMLDEKSDKIEMVDGYEQAYGSRTENEFIKNAQRVKTLAAKLSRNPEKYTKEMGVGFGIFLDRINNFKWYTKPADFHMNFYTPWEFAYVMNCALKHGKYAWVYSHITNWWTGENCPFGYIDALRKAKTGKVPVPRTRTPVQQSATLSSYSTCRQHSKQAIEKALPDLWKNNRMICNLSGVWIIHKDAEEKGEQDGWYKTDYDDKRWETIVVPEWWECSNKSGWKNYNGTAWYRVRFKTPGWIKDMPVKLLFGGVDDGAVVWLNGQKLGTHQLGQAGWEMPFDFDVTGKLMPAGQENILAVRVSDVANYGGIWRDVLLVSPLSR